MHYKKINIPNYDLAQKELMAFIEGHFDDLTVEKAVSVLHADIEKHIPLLMDFFEKNSLKPDCYLVFFRRPFTDLPIHIDGTKDEQKDHFLGLQLPIKNCDNTFMRWFDASGEDWKPVHYSDGNYCRVSDKEIPPVASVESTVPILARVDIPHQEINPNNRMRYLMSVRFNPHPMKLWETDDMENSLC